MATAVGFNCPHCGQAQTVQSSSGYEHRVLVCTVCRKRAKVETAAGRLKKVEKV